MNSSPDPIEVTCSGCGQRISMPAEYVAQYGGAETTCSCGATIAIPRRPPGDIVPVPAPLLYRSPDEPGEQNGMFGDRNLVVLAPHALFPPRCCVCNEPIARPLRPNALLWQMRDRNTGANVSWGSRTYGHEAIPVTLQVGFCRAHRLRRWWKYWISAAFALGAVGSVIAGEALDTPATRNLMLVFLLPFFPLVAIALMMLGWRGPFRIERKRNVHFWIKGFGRAYVQSLPSLAAHKSAEADGIASRLR